MKIKPITLTAASAGAIIVLLAISGRSAANQSKIPESSSTLNNSLKEARSRILEDRPYKLDRNEKVGNIEVYIKPFRLQTEDVPDWWSEKQSYDLAKLLEEAMGYYPGVTIIRGDSWEEKTVSEELGQPYNAENDARNPSLVTGQTTNTLTIQPIVTNYTFQAFKPKKRGLGLVFIAITNKSCKTESFISTQTELLTGKKVLRDSQAQGSAYDSFDRSFTASMVRTTETGGTSLNVNALFAGAGGGDFKPPEKATRELIYDTVADIAEGSFCMLSGNQDCISYYLNRVQPKPTPPQKDKKGKIIKLKPEELKC